MGLIQKIKYLIARVIRVITFPYQLGRNAWPIWFFILNRKARKLFLQSPPRLDEIQKRLAEDLKLKGIATVHISELFNQDGTFEKLQQFTQHKLDGDLSIRGKRFLRSLIGDVPTLDFENPFILFVLHKKILGVVNSYMGLFAKFVSFSLDLTMPVGADAKPERSQLWHRDPEDKKMCKVFLYLSDVDETAGPFTYITESQYGGRWRRKFPPRFPRGYYPPAGAVEKTIPSQYFKVCTARAGTIIFCDTSGLHRGGYATQKTRTMFTAAFSSSASLRPIQFSFPQNLHLPELDDAAAYALSR